MWYYEFKDQQIGPVAESELRQKITAGVVRRSTLIWNETMLDWEAAGATMPAAFEGVTASSGDDPYSAPAASPGEYTERSSDAPGSTPAKFAFALGIFSIVVGLLFGAVGLFLGFGAIFLGALVRNKTRRGGFPVPRHARLAIKIGAIGVVVSIINMIGAYYLLKARGML